MKRKTGLQKARQRNPVAANPLLGRGHVHQKNHKARRRQQKVELKQAYREQSKPSVLLTVCRTIVAYLCWYQR